MQAQRFLTTGGSQGIGAAIVGLAREAGHEVVFTGRNEDIAEMVMASLSMRHRALWAEVAVFATNPWKGD